MSVLDELTRLENEVRARMTELRPLLEEYGELEKVAGRLGIAADEAPTTKQRRAAGSPRRASASKPRRVATTTPEVAVIDDAPKASPGRAGTKAKSKATRKKASAGPATAKKSRQPGGSRSSQRAEQLAELVQRRPGLTVKDAGAEFGVDPTSLYRFVKQLESDGKLQKRGRELHPA